MIIDKQLVAYEFLKNSGLSTTSDKAGYAGQKIFSGDNPLTTGIGLVISSALSLLGIIFLGLTIYAGILWMTDEGNEERAEKAKKILSQSMIGLVIVLAAYAISFFVISSLSSQTLK